MNKKIMKQFVGKRVEVLLDPSIPRSSGVLTKCEEDYVMIGKELWSYKAILGIRTLDSKDDDKQDEKNEKSEKDDDDEKNSKDEKESEIKNEKEKIEPNIFNFEIPNREFTGKLVAFYYERGYWGFIESEEVQKLGVPLRDGERVFVHLNQVTDDKLREKLMKNRNNTPNIDVIFKLTYNRNGVAADYVREAVNESQETPTETQNETPKEISNSESNSENKSENVSEIDIPPIVYDESEYEDGEIEYFRRYEEFPHGEIRVKGNKLYRFEENDVIDPLLAVFLECSPSAEGQLVKFIKTMGKKGKMKAINVKAATAFPDEKIKDWEKSGLIKKAKERLGISD